MTIPQTWLRGLFAAGLLGLAAAAAAQDREGARQGGDTMADAFVISTLPFTETGTTVGFTDDYDAICPYGGSTAPDVVYVYVPATDMSLDIDMCGSGFDTKLYVIQENLVACNDDHHYDSQCGYHTSRLEDVVIEAGVPAYIVIDGYGNSAGDYVVSVQGLPWQECYVAYPPGATDESEPTLANGYDDQYNGGCDSGASPHFQELTSGVGGIAVVYGRSGWYHRGASCRDTDWFIAEAAGATVTATIIAEEPVRLVHIGGDFQGCGDFYAAESATTAACEVGEVTFAAGSNEMICLWIGPTVFTAPDGFIGFEFDYVLEIDGLYRSVATEGLTWGAVKALYD